MVPVVGLFAAAAVVGAGAAVGWRLARTRILPILAGEPPATAQRRPQPKVIEGEYVEVGTGRPSGGPGYGGPERGGPDRR